MIALQTLANKFPQNNLLSYKIIPRLLNKGHLENSYLKGTCQLLTHQDIYVHSIEFIKSHSKEKNVKKCKKILVSFFFFKLHIVIHLPFTLIPFPLFSLLSFLEMIEF